MSDVQHACPHVEDTCDHDCPGWGWFNSNEIQACIDCGLYETDEDARDHVAECDDCQQLLAAWVADEAKARAPGAKPKRQKTRITIVLEVAGNPLHVDDVIKRVLDAGTLQDAINEDDGDHGPLRVTSAVHADSELVS